MSDNVKPAEIKHPTMTSYVVGFALSILLTLFAYMLTMLHVSSSHEVISHEVLIPAIIGLAVIQLMVQLVFFLHLLQESKPRWNLVFFVGTLSLVFLVVVASIWIMDHLNYNMTPQQMNNFILKDEGLQQK